ncbi:hypothetical protein NM208_g10422 [Fusarium decemcellulare]|uniref:Uncharacterized protein n=1 Tax=Fusarium decemcellulare TaxID=57161 RepID=A0ACC1RXY9_9HYPO|nr:hypothetical protein NM208_g10422 [Fusarium decemcellulare]
MALPHTMSNEEWEEVAQDVPSLSDPFLQQRLYPPIAQRACDIVDRIRDHENASVWTPQVEEELAQAGNEPTCGRLSAACPRVPSCTPIWDAMVNFDFLLDELMKMPGMHMSSDQPLTTETAREDAALSFRYRAKERTDGSIWDDKYEPESFLLLSQVADEFPDGGRPGFLKWLKGRCTLSVVDSHEQHHGIDAIWVKFAKCFMVVATIIHYEPMFRSFLRHLMKTLKDDGVNWAELRFTWPLNYCRDQQEEPEKDYTHMFEVLREEITRFQNSPEGKGFWGLTTIWTAIRRLPTRDIVENMDCCIATKIDFPDLIAGYDLVGAEDLGRPLSDLLPELFWFRKQCAMEGVNLPFFFHAGETLGDGTDTDGNLFDAILLGTRRIGHGFSLFKHPLLIDMVKEKRILIESCPISNEVLRLCGSVTAHPLPALLARGVACSLCNDDPAMLGQDTAGMSHDFWQALQGWKNLGLAGLGSLAENSVRWAAFEDQNQAEWVNGIKEASLGDSIKAKRMQEWQVEWEKFCLWVVEEYGDRYGSEQDAKTSEDA